MRRGLRFGAGAIAGISLGVVLTLAIQAWRLPPEAETSRRVAAPAHAAGAARDLPRVGAARPSGRLRRAGGAAS